ncbi:hypothetical protein TNCV_117331 [Trichonephila clavipes]|nr:hypothetical protein TNCV_117331 [Trichonephila clavipes]
MPFLESPRNSKMPITIPGPSSLLISRCIRKSQDEIRSEPNKTCPSPYSALQSWTHFQQKDFSTLNLGGGNDK